MYNRSRSSNPLSIKTSKYIKNHIDALTFHVNLRTGEQIALIDLNRVPGSCEFALKHLLCKAMLSAENDIPTPTSRAAIVNFAVPKS
jgi:hypothetical protein